MKGSDVDDRLDVAFAQWMKKNEEFGRIVVVDRAALNALSRQNVRGPLRWFAAGLWFELVMAIVPVVFLGYFGYGALHAPVELASAAILDVFAILFLANVVAQLAALYGIDYDGPVATVQSALERVRVLRLRAARGIFVFAVLAWLPLCIVGLSALFGSGMVGALDVNWIAANLIVGILFVPFAIWLCRFVERRAGSGPFVRAVVATISGSKLNAALSKLGEVERFTRDSS
jgi:hypothetical protein